MGKEQHHLVEHVESPHFQNLDNVGKQLKPVLQSNSFEMI